MYLSTLELGDDIWMGNIERDIPIYLSVSIYLYLHLSISIFISISISISISIYLYLSISSISISKAVIRLCDMYYHRGVENVV